MNFLLTAISNSAGIAEDGRQLAAVMLRRLFSSEFEEFYAKVKQNPDFNTILNTQRKKCYILIDQDAQGKKVGL